MKKLYRSNSDKRIAGVCGGLADYLDVDSTIIRLVFVLLLFMATGGFWVYLILWIIIPEEPVIGSNSIDVEVKPKEE